MDTFLHLTRALITCAPLPFIYSGLITTLALTAVFPSKPARRKAAREVLRLLLPGRSSAPASTAHARIAHRRREPPAIEPPTQVPNP